MATFLPYETLTMVAISFCRWRADSPATYYCAPPRARGGVLLTWFVTATYRRVARRVFEQAADSDQATSLLTIDRVSGLVASERYHLCAGVGTSASR